MQNGHSTVTAPSLPDAGRGECDNWREFKGLNACILPGLHKNERGRPCRASSGTTETTIQNLALRPARLAAGLLLSCALAPACAGQPAPQAPVPACETAGKPCPAARAVPEPRQNPECGRLRAAILDAEQSERRVRTAMMEAVQQDLLILRKRYRKLGCRAPATA